MLGSHYNHAKRGRPALLASVANADEAGLCLRAGADVIDCKNPNEGALGALPSSVVRDVCRTVAGRRLVSATVGDFFSSTGEAVERVRDMATTGVDFVKVGFVTNDPNIALVELIKALGDCNIGASRLVVVLFGDLKPDYKRVVAEISKRSNFSGIMIDTASKNAESLLSYVDLSEMADFVDAAHRHGLFAGLAGSLDVKHIPTLTGTGADILGFRGALCAEGKRGQALDLDAVKRVRDSIGRSGKMSARISKFVRAGLVAEATT